MVGKSERTRDEVGKSETTRDEMLLELEQECLEVYRRKIDVENHYRVQQLREMIVQRWSWHPYLLQ